MNGVSKNKLKKGVDRSQTMWYNSKAELLKGKKAKRTLIIK